MAETVESERPLRMFRNGRPDNPTFHEDERLYFRVKPANATNGQIELTEIRYPDFSVNREKYGEPEDVVYGYSGFAIAYFLVKDVPEAETPANSEFTYDFVVVHCPEEKVGEENFAHCEVRSRRNGVFNRELKLPKTVKSRYRQALAERTQLYKAGQVFG